MPHPDGHLRARFYEFKTNRPLYFTSDSRSTYRLTYDDSDLPDHYSFQAGSYPTSVESNHDEIVAKGIQQYNRDHEPVELTAEEKLAKAEAMEQAVRETLAAQTDKGVWLSKNLITMRTVQRSMRVLSDYLGYVNDR
jgi:hypothetical protein